VPATFTADGSVGEPPQLVVTAATNSVAARYFTLYLREVRSVSLSVATISAFRQVHCMAQGYVMRNVVLR